MGVEITRDSSGKTEMRLNGESINKIIEDNKRLKTFLSFLPRWLRNVIEILGLASLIGFVLSLLSIIL